MTGRAGLALLAALVRFMRYAYIPVAILLLIPPIFNWLERNRDISKCRDRAEIKCLKLQRSASLQQLAAKRAA